MELKTAEGSECDMEEFFFAKLYMEKKTRTSSSRHRRGIQWVCEWNGWVGEGRGFREFIIDPCKKFNNFLRKFEFFK